MAPRPRPGDGALDGDEEEPYGTTPLPTAAGDGGAARLWIDASHLLAAAQQPQAHHIAGGLDAAAVVGSGDGAGAGIAVNGQFLAYVLKNSLIRVMHRHSTLKALLRQHQGAAVRDLQFFPEGDILATVATRGGGASGSCLFVWRLFETQTDIGSHALLEIRAPHVEIARVVWHPFNPNQLWMLHSGPGGAASHTVATLVESTRLETAPEDDADAATTGRQHPVCRVPEDGVVADGAIQIAHDGDAGLTDLCWSSRHMRHVLTTFSNGDIALWDLKQLIKFGSDGGPSRAVSPTRLGTVRDHRPVSSCRFLPHDRHARGGGTVGTATGDNWTSCFITGSQGNQVVTIWSAFGPGGGGTPMKLQELNWERPSSRYLLSVCSGPAPATALSPPSCFLVWADCAQGSAFAVHVRSTWSAATGAAGPAKQALLVGCDYVVPFRTQSPTYSWNVQTVPTTDISEEDLNEQGSLVFDMKVFAYQATMVQALTVTSYMCLPPESSWVEGTRGVRMERLLEGAPSVNVSDIGSIEDANGVLQYDENYDIDDDGGQDDYDSADDEFEAPEASTLPLPSTNISTSSLVNNPFANWLGALASNSRSALPVSVAPTSPGDPIVLQESPPKTSAEVGNVSPPPPLASPEFLSPIDILKASEPSVATLSSPQATQSSGKQTATNDGAQKKLSKPVSSVRPQILKRDDKAHPIIPVESTSLSPEVGSTPSITLSDDLRRAVREEIQTSIAEQLKSVQETSHRSSSAVKDLQGALSQLKVDNIAQAATVATKVEASLQSAFADSIRTVMIPSMESITNQILANVSDHIEKVDVQRAAAQNELAAMTKQLAAVTQLVAKLTEEVKSLRNSVTQQQLEASPPPLPVATKATAVDSTEKIKNEISAALRAKKYADAFTKAVSASTAEIALYCCANADINDVFGGTNPELSQMILLCLMQQLGTFLSSRNSTSDLQLELKWLQEIALSLSPSDPMIAKHVPSVLQQLVAGVNTRMAQNDPALRRPLQRLLQIIRGMQVTQT